MAFKPMEGRPDTNPIPPLDRSRFALEASKAALEGGDRPLALGMMKVSVGEFLDGLSIAGASEAKGRTAQS